LDATGDGRTIVGRCVPYGVPKLVADGDGTPYTEVWRRGAFRRSVKAPNRVLLNYEHREGIGDVIGHAVSLTETDDGLEGEFRALSGTAGDQALELIRAGVTTGLSVSCAIPPTGSRLLADGVVERTLATLRHVALTGRPAYDEAMVTATRSASLPTIAEIRRQNAALRA
jgi:HK97 family phage prohead protease